MGYFAGMKKKRFSNKLTNLEMAHDKRLKARLKKRQIWLSMKKIQRDGFLSLAESFLKGISERKTHK